MAKLNNVQAFILPYKDRVCVFCGNEITYGAYWSGAAQGICVGDCCKDRLIHMYKDIVLEKNCDRLDSFIYDIKKDIQECYDKSIKIHIEIEKNNIRKSCLNIKEYESNIFEDFIADLEIYLNKIKGE